VILRSLIFVSLLIARFIWKTNSRLIRFRGQKRGKRERRKPPPVSKVRYCK